MSRCSGTKSLQIGQETSRRCDPWDFFENLNAYVDSSFISFTTRDDFPKHQPICKPITPNNPNSSASDTPR